MSKAGKRFDYDVAIIGGGSAGYAAARIAVGAGLKTVVIEGGKEVGGLCILRGCMPSKTLLHAAEVLHHAKHTRTFGVHAKSVGFNFSQVMARKTRLIKEFADYRRQQLDSGRFKFIRAQAWFQDPHTLRLSNGKTLTAKHFIIAAGSITAPPPLPELAKACYITSDEALSLRKLPKSMIVLGGGATGVELVQFFVRFGVKVTMIQRSPHILKEFDRDAAAVIETVLRREGVKLYTDTHLLDAWCDSTGKSMVFKQGGKTLRVKAEEIFFALGRIPNTAELELQNAGIETEGTRIITNARMETTAPHVYAAGDCTGPHEIVHIAIQQAETAAHNIVHPRKVRKIDYRLLTSVIFTDPQIGVVGLTELEAKARKVPYLVASYPFNDHGKSMIMDAMDGFVKLLAHPRTGEILGGCCVGPMGGELIHEIIVAMDKRMTVHELARMPHYHPTLAEIWTYPAEELADKIKSPRR